MKVSLPNTYRIVFLQDDPFGPRWGYKKIGRVVRCDIRTVQYWVKRYNENKNSGDKPKSGRNMKNTEKEDKNILNMVTTNETSTSRSIAGVMESRMGNLSHTTVWRRLKQGGLKYQAPLKKPLLQEKHCKNRLIWARENLDLDLISCVFTDKTTFELFKYTNKCCHLSGSRKIAQTVKHSQKLHVWGCFSNFGFGKLYLFEENLDANPMTKICENALLPFISMLFSDLSTDWILQEDNDPKHKSKIASQFKEDFQIRVLPWPSCLLDLNPIENVWSLLKYKVY